MKTTSIAAITLVTGFALATSVFAQGRHDEKPHSSSKPSASAPEDKCGPMTGGRHDEKPHGPCKPVAKKTEPAKSSNSGQGSK
jgi:hypothetical protein